MNKNKIKKMKERQSAYRWDLELKSSMNKYDEKHNFEDYQGLFNIPERLNRKITPKQFFEEFGVKHCRSCIHFKHLFKHPENLIFEGDKRKFSGIFRCDVSDCIIEHSTICDDWEWNGEV